MTSSSASRITASPTPGPWSWDPEGGYNAPDGSRIWHLCEGPEGDQGGSIFEGGFVLADDATNEANARLIKAAPVLLDALLAVHWRYPLGTPLRAQLDAAIAEATGAAS